MSEDGLEYPRWEHHDDFLSELVNTPQERAKLMHTWSIGHGKPKPAKGAIYGKKSNTIDGPKINVTAKTEAAPPPIASPLAPAKVEPAFTVYDLATDSDVPLTQDRLDALTLAEECMGLLWPAIRRDGSATVEGTLATPFPPETSVAIAKVHELLAGTVSEKPVGEAAPVKRKSGRPPKPKPDEAATA